MAQARKILLRGLGLSAARLNRLAHALNASLGRAVATPGGGNGRPDPADDSGTVLLCFQETPPDDFEGCLALPCCACIEVFDSQDTSVIGALQQAVQADLCLSVGTVTAYSQPLARALIEGIASRVTLSNRQREGIELAVQEAVGNAVMHGNLMLESFATTAERLVSFSTAIAERLNDRTFAHRRVHLLTRFGGDHLTIEVGDEGTGYQPEPVRTAGVFGRGLQLIGAFASDVELLDDGRRIRMSFAL